jgi:uncharacterized membrane protein YeaQ/YmgE (transglycosylase-associated protein family)
MQPFDEEYMARREAQIKELYEMRAGMLACLITGVILGFIGLYVMRFGNPRFGYVLLGISGLFSVGSLFMITDYFGKQAADRAIRKERMEMWQMSTMEKPKRSLHELSDDGEILIEEPSRSRESRRG